eukprot:351602-Chlamydomonas_euryale.AAC.1
MDAARDPESQCCCMRPPTTLPYTVRAHTHPLHTVRGAHPHPLHTVRMHPQPLHTMRPTGAAAIAAPTHPPHPPAPHDAHVTGHELQQLPGRRCGLPVLLRLYGADVRDC